MLIESDKEKAHDFINHLLANPNIKNEPVLIQEGLILNFIVQNLNQFKATFKTPQFFPHLEWNEVLQAIVDDLQERAQNAAMPILDNFIDSARFDTLNKLLDGNTFPDDFHKEKLHQFVQNIFKNKDVRYNMNSVINMIQYEAVDRYINEIFHRRDYIYNEIVRVQKTYLECDEYIVFVKTLLLLKNAAFLKVMVPSSGTKINITDATKVTGGIPKFLDGLNAHLRGSLPNISEKTLRLAAKSNLKDGLTDVEEASSRLVYILSARFQNYTPNQKIDRGAESPDKSWFAVAKKNYEYYGFNKRMVEELYRMAADNNW